MEELSQESRAFGQRLTARTPLPTLANFVVGELQIQAEFGAFKKPKKH
jgi:hypothetical protein